MPHNQRIRPPGMWTPNGALLAAEVELLDQAQYLELHEGGGTWALQSNVVIGAVGSASWTFTAPVVVNDISGHVVNGKTLSLDAGAMLDLSGTQRIEPGAALRVLGAAQNPGTIWVEQLGKLIITTNGYFGIYGAGTGDVFGTLNIQKLGTVDVQDGGTIKVEAGGLLQVAGTPQKTAKVILGDSSEVDVGDGATIQVVGGTIVLTNQGGAWVKLISNAGAGALFAGNTFISDRGAGGSNGTLFVGSIFGSGVGHLQVGGGGDLTVAYGGIANINDQSTLNLNAGSTVHFDGAAKIKGTPTFLDDLILGAAATATFSSGSTFGDGSLRTYSGPQIPWGPNAVQGIPKPLVASTPAAGAPTNNVEVDPSGLVLLDAPQNLSGDMGLSIKPPSHPEVPRLLFIRQRNPSVQGGFVVIVFVTKVLVTFQPDGSDHTPGCAVLVWDTVTWSVVFAVGAQILWP